MAQKVGFSVQSFTIDAGAQIEIAFLGDALTILAATGDVHVGLDGGPRSRLEAGLGYKLPPGQEFVTVSLENRGGAAITVEIALALGDVRDSRLNLSGAVNISGAGALVSTADATVGVAAAAVLAANADRRAAFLKADPANTTWIRVGDANVAAGQGIRLDPGESVIIETTAEIEAIAGAAAQTLQLLETRN